MQSTGNTRFLSEKANLRQSSNARSAGCQRTPRVQPGVSIALQPTLQCTSEDTRFNENGTSEHLAKLFGSELFDGAVDVKSIRDCDIWKLASSAGKAPEPY
jgi:hypothetical protein